MMPDIEYLKRLEDEHRFYSDRGLTALEASLTAKKYLLPRIANRRVLEMGCGTLTMTRLFLEVAALLDVVDGAESFISQASNLLNSSPKGGRAYYSLFESFIPEQSYQSIVLANTLLHLNDPVNLLEKIRDKWLTPDGELLMIVQNVFSLHRKLGVKMGLLANEFIATETNLQYCQPGRYSATTLRELLVNAGFEVKELFGFYLKPFSLKQMSRLSLTEKELDALFEIGRDFEDMANLIFVRAVIPSKSS